MSGRLTPEYEAAIRRVASLPADAFGGVYRAQITALLAELAAVRVERDALQKRLHDAAMTRTWRNEDGKKFVFVEDIAPALLGITPGSEATS